MKILSRKILYRYQSKNKIPYLIRWTLFQCRLFSIKIHKALISDIGPLHDHPWSYLSIILKGGYFEHTEEGSKWYGPGSILLRKANKLHKLEIPKGKSSLSLIFTSAKWRQWGFNIGDRWKPHNKVDLY